ncbi:DUF500 domain containing protein [Niveomyces insectorum RCEF 264]|uniref:DUF500 domain containing protein n=1 Tax=Niveomyces insectorum RCEF 264 TaxID=1081102 RepID=A0A167PIE5_9HYPO|nr:DUF500 domain containing protein [Niveomyces insectorum RCEF 264]
MQRVSSLLPLWEKAKPGDHSSGNSHSNRNSNASATAPATGARHNRTISSSSNASNNNAYNNHSNHYSHTRNSSGSGSGNPLRSARSFNKVFSWTDRIGAHKTLSVSSTATNAGATATPSSVPRPLGREAYWPTGLDRECEKAARILKSFCTDGFFDEAADAAPLSPTSRTSVTSLTAPPLPPRPSADVASGSPSSKSLGVAKKKIPPRIIQEAVGLAIFSCMRSGLWMSGSGGSGILIARKADGTWSPPSGILLHTSTVAFVLGVDIYDCVLVINSVSALEMFTRPRLTLGADVPLTVGPLVSMGLLENDIRLSHEMSDTVLTYLKARGRHSPAQLYGSLVTERSNENERFYYDGASLGGSSQPVDILDILAGNVRKSIPEIVPLFEAIKAAEGRIDFDTAVMDRLSQQPAPGDADIADAPDLLAPTSPTSATFGKPDASDPDPFGIIALEMAGLEIREAGSKHRPASHQFDYNASPTSPVFASHFRRQSADAVAAEQGNRTSYLSTRTQATSMTDAGTQTADVETPGTSLSPSHSDDGHEAIAAPASVLTNEMSATLDVNGAQTKPGEPHFVTSGGDVAVAATGNSENRGLSKTVSQASEATATTNSKHLAVDRGMATTDDLSDGDNTAVSSQYVEDERDGDADDEDEETDGFGDGLTNDFADDDDDDDDDTDDGDEEEEPVIYEVATSASRPMRALPTQVAHVIQAKGALVTIPKRVPPPLPLRSPARASRASKSDYGDLSMVGSPLRHSFQSSQSTSAVAQQAIADSSVTPLSDVATTAAPQGPLAAAANGADSHEKAVSPFSSPSPPAAYDSATTDPTTGPKSGSADDFDSTSTPQATGPATSSSMDESDREPQTPQTPRPDDALSNDALKTVHHNVSPKDDVDQEAASKVPTQETPEMAADHGATPSITAA